MATLFSIKDEYLAFYEMATTAIDEAQDAVELDKAINAFKDTLESIKGELSTKAEGYVAVLDRLKQEQKRAKEIKDKYSTIEQNRKDAIARINATLMMVTDEMDMTEMPAGDVSIKIVKNGGQLPMEITGDVPDNMAKVTIEPDNAKIRAYLESEEGKDCEWAHFKERGRHIVVK